MSKINLTAEQTEELEKISEVIKDGDISIAQYVLGLEKKFEERVEEIREGFKSEIEKAIEEIPDVDTILSSIRGKDGEKPVAGIDYPIPKDGVNGTDGKNFIPNEADKKEIAGMVKIPIVEKIVIEKTEVVVEKPIENNIIKEVAITDNPTQIREKLESLKDDERLDKSAIKGLDEEIDSVLKKVSNIASSASGGVTNLRIRQAFKYLLHTEQPAGLIDGANTTYRVQNEIFAILSMAINGEIIAQLPNYTISGKIITFASALPAAYSSKDFEIKYL